MRPAASRLGLLVCLTLLVGCDHASKLAAKTFLEGHEPRQLIHGVVDLHYTENTDVAFNLLRDMPDRMRAVFLVFVGGFAAVILLGLLFLRRGQFGRFALLFVTAGAIANYVDRLARGYVVDFIQVPHWPVFNVADVYVTVGGIVLCWLAFRARREV
jgi:signal peptidase II